MGVGTCIIAPIFFWQFSKDLLGWQFKTQPDFTWGRVSIKLSPLSSDHLVHQFLSSIPYFHLKTCSFLCLNTIPNTHQSTFNCIAMKGKFKMRNFRGTFIMANLQRCISQPCYTLIKTEVRISLNTYKIAKNSLFYVLLFLQLLWALIRVQSFGLWVHTTIACCWILGGDCQSHFCTKDKLHPMGWNHFLG